MVASTFSRSRQRSMPPCASRILLSSWFIISPYRVIESLGIRSLNLAVEPLVHRLHLSKGSFVFRHSETSPCRHPPLHIPKGRYLSDQYGGIPGIHRERSQV